MTKRAPLAVVTMVYNESDFLPLWLRYYGGQVDLENCFVIDHGSDDQSTDVIAPANRMRIPRSPLDEGPRAHFISGFCSSLLTWYDAVIYCDVDEILVADPALWGGLVDLAVSTRHHVVTAFGMNVLHWLHREVELVPAAPILPQRRRAFVASSMSKPLMIRRPVTWEAGFHSADASVVFDGLFNFHLAYFDLGIAWRRQAKRRATSYRDDEVAKHHRISDGQLLEWMDNWSQMPPLDEVRLDESCPQYNEVLRRILASERTDGRPGYRIDTGIWGDRLWRIPDRFSIAF